MLVVLETQAAPGDLVREDLAALVAPVARVNQQESCWGLVVADGSLV